MARPRMAEPDASRQPAGVPLRFGSWNVNNRDLRIEHVQHLRRQRLDLLALQEVSTSFHEALASESIFRWGVYSIPLEGEPGHRRPSRRLGCSIFGRQPWSLRAARILRQLDFPERSLVVELCGHRRRLTVCSFHIPPGVSWGETKPRTMRAIAKWLGRQEGRVLVGIDANAPKTDHPDHAGCEWWWDEEPSLLGPTPDHDLRDALRAYFMRHPRLLERVRRRRPRGPLAVSHRRGMGARRTDCRYDFVYVSAGIEVVKVEHPFVRSLSDHALVVSRLRI